MKRIPEISQWIVIDVDYEHAGLCLKERLRNKKCLMFKRQVDKYEITVVIWKIILIEKGFSDNNCFYYIAYFDSRKQRDKVHACVKPCWLPLNAPNMLWI